jgi:hypothetical protein
VSTIPVEVGGKRPVITWKRWQSELPAVSQLADWFYQTDHNIAVITGGDAGLVALDFDTSDAFAGWVRRNKGTANATRIESTPNGYHAYLFVTEPVESQWANGIEVKSGGQCCNVAPSRQEGGEYMVIQDKPVLRVESLADVLSCVVGSGVGRGTGRPAVHQFDTPEPMTQDDGWNCAGPQEALSRLGTATAPSKEKSAQPDRDPDALAFSFTRRRLARASAPPGGLVAEIKSRLSILDLLLRYTDPQASSNDGAWWLMRCPNPKHHDEHPSFWANTNLGICGCYAPWCRETQPGGKSMDVISLYAWLHGCNNADAIKQLAHELSDGGVA